MEPVFDHVEVHAIVELAGLLNDPGNRAFVVPREVLGQSVRHGGLPAIRVEARLRRHLPEQLKPKEKGKSDGMGPLSKDQRILE